MNSKKTGMVCKQVNHSRTRGDALLGNSKIIEVDNLEKSYGDVHAVKESVSMLRNGSCLPFLVPMELGNLQLLTYSALY